MMGRRWTAGSIRYSRSNGDREPSVIGHGRGPAALRTTGNNQSGGNLARGRTKADVRAGERFGHSVRQQNVNARHTLAVRYVSSGPIENRIGDLSLFHGHA